MEAFEIFTFTVATATAMVVGLVWALGKVGLPKEWKPVMSIILGLVTTVYLSDLPTKEAIFSGIMLGLTAGGAWSGTKTTKEGIKKLTSKQ